jgi:PAS domain S-box-containing protein
VFGWAAEEVLGRKPDFTFTPEDQGGGRPAWEFDTARDEGQAPDVRWHMRKDGSRVFIDGSARALHNADGRFRGVLKIGQDTTERRRADERLRESEQRLRSLMEGVPQLVWRADRPGHWSWSSPQWTAYTGLSAEESRGPGWLEALHPEDRDRARRAWTEAAVSGVLDAEWRLCGGSERRYRWFHTRATPVTDKDGRVEWIGASTEIEEAKRLQAHTEMLVAELQHRVRNILAVVRSIARRTGDTSATVEDYAAHLQGRISSLARTQNVLTRTPGSGVNLEELVGDELLAHAVQEDQVTIGGPAVRLQGKAAETLGLALHELATNAVKYGALAVPGGGLSVTWAIEPAGDVERLCLNGARRGVSCPGRPSGAVSGAS